MTDVEVVSIKLTSDKVRVAIEPAEGESSGWAQTRIGSVELLWKAYDLVFMEISRKDVGEKALAGFGRPKARALALHSLLVENGLNWAHLAALALHESGMAVDEYPDDLMRQCIEQASYSLGLGSTPPPDPLKTHGKLTPTPGAAANRRFVAELKEVIGRHSQELWSGTPDIILAKYLAACLDAFDSAIHERATWYFKGD